ncbi:MAG: YceI family protein [Bacteroidota bacterium]
MKIALKFFTLLTLFAVSFACSSPDKGEQVEAEEATEAAAEVTASAVTYSVDTESSTINWQGYKKFDIGDEHTGTIKISDGSLALTGDQLTAGEFTIDMTSMESIDLAGTDGAGKLIGHLQSPDFFSIEEYPTASFAITKVEAVEGSADVTHNITGNLTMRGQTKQITIPANVSIADGKITAVAPEFTIDRTQWGVEYGNEGIAGLAKDKVISNDLTLKIMLNASASES